MTRGAIHVVVSDLPPRRVLMDARAAFSEPVSRHLLPVVGRLAATPPSSLADPADEVGDDVVMFKDDEIVVFMWSRRVPGGSRLTTEVFGVFATAKAILRRPAMRTNVLVSRRSGCFESATIPSGPACLVIGAGNAVVRTRHCEWLTL